MKLTKVRKHLLDELVAKGGYGKTRSEVIERLVDAGLAWAKHGIATLPAPKPYAQGALGAPGESPAAEDDLFPPAEPGTLLSQPGSAMEPIAEPHTIDSEGRIRCGNGSRLMGPGPEDEP